MLIRNVDPRRVALEIDATGQVVEPDGTVDVPHELGASLAEQAGVWAADDTTSSAPAAATTEESA